MPFPQSSTSHEPNGSGNGHGPAKPSFIPVMAPPSLVEQTDEADFSHLLRVFKRRAGVFLGVTALSLGLSVTQKSANAIAD